MVCVYALSDMMIYNRKKRAQFFSEQQAQHMNALHSAQMAQQHGTATEEQVALIETERAQAQAYADAEKAKAARKGIFGRSKDWLFSGLKQDEEVLAEGGKKVEEVVKDVGGEAKEVVGANGSRILKAVEEKKEGVREKIEGAWEREKNAERTGGPFDRIGTGAAEEPAPKSGGWTSFMTGR